MIGRYGKPLQEAWVQAALLLAVAVLPAWGSRSGVLRVSGALEEGLPVITWDEYGYDDVAGFRVHRLSGDRATPLHDDWISVDFNRSGGASYRLPDPAMKAGAESTYRIDGLQMDGSVVTLGTWTIRFPESAPEALATGKEDPVIVADGPATGPALKVPVLTNDIYAVTFEAIAAGLGLAVEDVGERARNQLLAMHTGGTAVSYWVDENRILFYGWPVTNRYTLVNYFWIEPGPGVHMGTLAAEPIPVPDDLTHVGQADFRERTIMVPDQYTALPDDFYFWSGFSGSISRSYTAILPAYATNDVMLAVTLRGWNTNLDHKAVIKWNDVELGNVLFSFKDEVVGTFTAPAAATNLLDISIVQPTNAPSLFALRKFDVSYQRYYAPIHGLLLANDGGHARLSAARFTDAIVLDVTDPYAPVRVVGPSVTIPAGHSWPVATGTRWAMREKASLPVVAPAACGFGTWMLSNTNRIDYLVVAPRAFAAPAEELASYRRSMGLRTEVAIFEDICDQFAHGLKTPDAIRDMLAYAHANWASPPWMVLLGGRGHFDYLELLAGTVPNHLPPLLGFDSTMLRPADILFADLTGDEIPDFSLGRIPVQTATQFHEYIAKLKTYEAGGLAGADDKAIFAADNADDGGDFAASNESLAAIADARYTIEQTGMDTNTVATVRTAITNALQAGYGILHYTGHGSPRQLAGENVLSDVNVSNMPPHAPVALVMSLTCYIGRFDDYRPAQKSLGETLVTKPDGGALAIYASSGLSWTLYAQQLAEVFYNLHAEGQTETVGLALAQARRQVGVSSELGSTSYRTYNLLGDPALKMRGHARSAAPAGWLSQYAQWRWERFASGELMDPEASGSSSGASGSESGHVADYIFGTQQPRLQAMRSADGGSLTWTARQQAADVEYRLLKAPEPWGPWLPVLDAYEITFAGTDDQSLQDASIPIAPTGERLFFKLQANLR